MESGWNVWVWLVGVVSRRWVWLLGVVVRRYIDFLILLVPTPFVSALFSAASLLLLIKKNAFVLVVMMRSSRFTHNVIIQFRVCMCFPV